MSELSRIIPRKDLQANHAPMAALAHLEELDFPLLLTAEMEKF
jgi:hypothetical protein